MRLAVPLLSLFAALAAVLPVFAGDPAPVAPAASAERLLQDLGSDDFRVREKASRDLAALGEAARPVLEKAMKENESLEVRWRCEQLLRRLDQQGERRIDEPAAEPEADAPEAGADPRENALRRYRQMERAFEEMKKRLEKQFGQEPFGFFPFPPGPGAGPGLDAGRGIERLFGRRRVEAPGLTLELLGRGGVALHVRRESESGVTSEEVFRGKSLEDVLAAHPDLAEHPSMAELKERLAAPPEDPFEAFGLGGIFPGGVGGTIVTSTGNSSVEIRQVPGRVVVTLRDRGEDGKEQVQTFEGDSLEAIKKAHPEIADRLRGMDVGFGPAARLPSPRIFRERRLAEGLEPMPEEQPERPAKPVTPAAEEARFGVEVKPVDEVLAAHLGLEAGGGLLVAAVVPGSQAERMGVERYDVLLRVGDVPASDADGAVRALRAAARENAPLTLEVVRAGRRQTLTR